MPWCYLQDPPGKSWGAKALTRYLPLICEAHRGLIYWFFYFVYPLRIRALSSKGQENRNKQSPLISMTFSQQSGVKGPWENSWILFLNLLRCWSSFQCIKHFNRYHLIQRLRRAKKCYCTIIVLGSWILVKYSQI